MAEESGMMVKGAGVAALQNFVQDRFKDRFDEWLRALPPASRDIFEVPVLVSKSYIFQDALVKPTRIMCDALCGGDTQAAWDAGEFSAEFALKGFFKVFLKLGSPQFIISRASRIFASYYSDAKLQAVESGPGYCTLHLTRFAEPDWLVELGIGGWMRKAVTLIGGKNAKVDIPQSLTKGDPVSEFRAVWE